VTYPYEPPQPPQQSPPAAPQPAPAGDLQFNHVEPATAGGAAAAPVASTCAVCHRPITDWYFAAGDKVVCPACRDRIVAAHEAGAGFGGFVRALAFGVLAGLAGALIWYAVYKFAHIQAALVAILVGFMVGGAVRAGSRGRGGLGYQFLAAILTYLTIAAAFAPLLYEEAMKPENAGASGEPTSAVVAAVVSCVLALIVPIGQAFSGGIIGALIVGFAVWQAWRLNRRPKLTLAGPYAVGPGVAPPGGAVLGYYGPGAPVAPPPVPQPPYAGGA
jgi:hypothetical protein